MRVGAAVFLCVGARRVRPAAVMTLATDEVIRRFLFPVLPIGLDRIRALVPAVGK